jgi:hypothetical protein
VNRKTKGTATISLISSVCVVAVSAIVLRLIFRDSPPPDFTDLYLLCVLGLASRYPWKFAAALAALSVAVSVYVLAPLDGPDGFQLASYAVCATVIIWVMASLRRRARRAS